MKTYQAAAFAAQSGVHKNTVKAWRLNGQLPDRCMPAGHRYDTDADVERYLGLEPAPDPRQTVVYGRGPGLPTARVPVVEGTGRKADARVAAGGPLGPPDGEGLGDRLRTVERKHRAKGNTQKADAIRRNNLGHPKRDRRRTRYYRQVRDHLCQAAYAVVDKDGILACEDLSAPMKSAPYRHRDTNRRLNGWVKGMMADTLTSISRRRGSALALVNPACTSQIDSRTGLLQGWRRGDRCCCRDGVVLDADINAACNIPARLYDDGIALYMPYREVKALLAERTGTVVGTAPPGLELRGLATEPPSTESKVPAPSPKGAS